MPLYKNLDLGVTGQVVKNTRCKLFQMVLANSAAAKRYVKLYNKATAPTNADVPVATIVLQAGQTLPVDYEGGVAFGAGLSLRASNAIADADNTAPTANDVAVSVLWKPGN
jgi:hypothetical protein